MNNKSYEQERMEREEKAKKTRRQLEKYTKDELLWMIETTCVVDHSANFWFLQFAVEVDSKRAESRLEAEEKAGDEWIRLMKEYEDLMRPYAGMKFKDIPMDVLNKAAVLSKRAEKAKEKYVAYFDQKGGE